LQFNTNDLWRRLDLKSSTLGLMSQLNSLLEYKAMIYPLYFKPKLYVFNDEQIKQIHMASLEILERTGVRVTHPRALELLESSGARVKNDRVRIPGCIIEEAIHKAPSRITLGRRSGERYVFLEGDKTSFGTCIDCLDYLDPLTDERRPFTSDDCRVTATVSDALPNYTHVMTLGLAKDTPPHIADRVIARQAITYCEKPLVFSCKDANSVRDIYEMALVIAGGKEQFQHAPTILNLGTPLSPLSHSDSDIEKLLFCAENLIPQIYISGTQAGATSPATFSGSIAQASAESLSGLVIAQLACPGAPYVFSALPTVMDMITTIFSYGAPEKDLMIAGMVQMAQYYKLPFFGTAGCSDAKFPDPQAAAEAAFSCLSSALSGANLVHDCGLLDHGSLVSPAHMVLVNDVLSMVRQYMKGIPVNDDSLALKVVDSVGPGGHFLEEEHTRKHFRNVWYPKLFDRTVKESWLEQGAKRFEERLRERTCNVMEHKVVKLPAEVIKELDLMEKNWQ
jgi:trimethylamine--corrinoid protein Co-methyltransferase